MVINLNDKLYKEIEQYCTLNNITNIENEILKFITIGFNCERFGNTPFASIMQVPNEKQEKKLEVQTLVEETSNETSIDTKIEVLVPKQEEKETIVKPKKKVKIIKND